MFIVDDRVRETSTTNGTGTYTLDGAPTGFQTFSSLGASNLCPYFATDDTNWETGIGTVLTAPNRLERTTIFASSNADAAVNWVGSTVKKIRCGIPALLAMPRVASALAVGGTGTLVLAQHEQRRQALVLTGTLTGARTIEVDATPWFWIIENSTTGDFALTFKVTGQTGFAVPRNARCLVYCNGTDVEEVAGARVPSLFALSGVLSPAQLTANQNDYNPSGLQAVSVLRVNADTTPRSITGLAGGEAGRVLLIHCTGGTVILEDEDAGSTAANRFALPTDVTLGPDQTALLWYDSTSSRWRLIGANGEFRTMQVFTASGTWNKPAGLRRVKVTVVGGGGGGGAATVTTSTSGGAGGGGGGCAIEVLEASALGNSETVTVGTGGGSASNGNTSSFGALCSATGGSAGGSSTDTSRPAGGAGGAGSGGNLNLTGQGGDSGDGTTAGAGGSSFMGGGGAGPLGFTNNANGNNGGAYGGGGSGGMRGNGAGSQSGGSGAAGVVIVEEFY